MTAMLPDAIIYDLDGTIIDSQPIVLNILAKVASEFGFGEINAATIGSSLSLGGERLVSEAFGIPLSESKIPLDRFREIYASTVVPETSLYPFVFSTLEALVSMGVRLCICTNKPRNLAQFSLEHTKLDSFFEFIVAGDDLSTKKPCRENVEHCLDRLELPPSSVLYVGDSLVDQRAATSAGVRFCFFESGYDDGVDKSNAFFTFKCHSEFERWFGSDTWTLSY